MSDVGNELWIAFRFFIFVLRTQLTHTKATQATRCELLSDFLSLFFEHNKIVHKWWLKRLWIAFRFFIFVLRTQLKRTINTRIRGCELLSDFLSLFFEHNRVLNNTLTHKLWIAFRFFIFVLRTQRLRFSRENTKRCELLSDFLSLFFEHNGPEHLRNTGPLWIAFRFFIFVLRTQPSQYSHPFGISCELLSDFLSLFFEHNKSL